MNSTIAMSDLNPVHNSQVHSHREDPRGEMNPLGDVTEQLVIKALHIVCVSTLVKQNW